MPTNYRMYDEPDNGTVGVNCGAMPYDDLPEHVQEAIDAAPQAGEWRVPARDSITDELLPGLTTIVTLDHGQLMDYYTAQPIRSATRDERDASMSAAAQDGGAGVIDVDGRSCYVAE